MNRDLNKSLSDISKQHEFDEVSEVYVSNLSDKELAQWQAQYEPQNPQYIIASHEWQRRLIVEQAKSSRLVALVGVLGTLLGVIVGHVLTKWW